ncbi:hypothetical protein LXEBMM8_EKPBGFGD_00894 [Lactiplantibacillus xiangfangensis]
MDKLKSKLVLSGVAAIAAFSFALNADAARMDMVDVSNHNGYMSTAEYNSMRTEFGVKAVTVKISEGTTYKDPYATSNIANVQSAKLYVNGYHFAHYTTKSQAIAEGNFAGRMAKASGLPVGAVLAADVEAGQGSVSKATNNANNKAFMKQVKKYGYRPDVYTMGSWVGTKMDLKKGTGWPASYPYDASGKTWYSWSHAWQFSSTAHFRISSGNFDASQLYGTYYTAGQKSTVKPTDKKAVKANSKKNSKQPAAQSNASAKWVKESKTYTLKTAVNLRTGASTSSKLIVPLPAGTTVKTDRAIIQGGYRWVRQPRSHGYGYLVTGPASNSLAYVKGGASHTHYTVKFGDSWWVIAQRNGLSMYTLAAKNGKSIYSTIYPGEKLIIK